jgi:hypothetical protein
MEFLAKSHRSCEAGGEEEKFGKKPCVDLLYACFLWLACYRLDRVLFRKRKIARKGNGREILVPLELRWFVVPVEVVSERSNPDFGVLRSLVINQS